MVGSNGTMIAIRLVRSKLRKREDAHHHHHHPQNTVHPEQVQVQCAPPCANNNNTTTGSTIAPPLPTVQVISNSNNNNNNNNDDCTDGGVINPAMSTSTSSVDSCCNVVSSNKANETLVYATATSAEQFIWQFPPPYPPPNTPPPQYTLYNDQDTLVHGLSQQDRQGFAKGFRKNLGGRWRRLVKRKPESEMCAIPPELKDQLKTIYVY